MKSERVPSWSKRLRCGSLALAFLLAAVLCVAIGRGLPPLSDAAETGASSPKRAVTVLHVTDFHGSLLSEDVDRASGKPVGGAAVLAAFVEAERESAGGEAILLDGGDMMQGSALSNLTSGAAVIEFMNSLGVDAAAVGNHEFDWGVKVLKERMAQARFPFLCANVFLGEGKQRPDWAAPFVVVQIAGLQVGIIGVITEDTPFLVNPKLIRGLRFDEPSAIVNEIAATLRKEGARLIIVLAHVGGAQEEDGRVVGPIEALASGLRGVDLVLGGHSHTIVAGKVGSIPVMLSGSNGRRIGVVRLEMDAASGQSGVVEQRVRTTFAEEVRPLERIEAIVETFKKEFSGEMERVVVVASERITRSRQESALGNLVCDVMRDAVGADVGFQNSGGIRADLEAGPVTVQEMFKILPFDNTIVTMYLTGEQVKQVLEHGTSESGVVQSSGLRYSYRPEAPPGERIKELALEDGSALVPGQLYLVATNDFMASGGDRYSIFAEGKDIVNTQILLREAVVSWMETLRDGGGELAAPELGRARRLSQAERAVEETVDY
ncbi:MAG: 5'-nucleotidase C-terminal domain-containing protein [Candidatus Eiseniibacteriota bacterium]|nr:MAG: 5'-nucleotidase C-terminal domain-containing protein [Candidatus Eisenbacteria bacterium]